jgi:hypothetical protein
LTRGSFIYGAAFNDLPAIVSSANDAMIDTNRLMLSLTGGVSGASTLATGSESH